MNTFSPSWRKGGAMSTELACDKTQKLPVLSGCISAAPIVFDRSYALSRLGGLEDVLIDVMKMMTTESVNTHAQISVAARRRDSVVMKRAAHTLRGAVSLVGAADLALRLKGIEGLAEAGDFERATAALPEIDLQFQRLQSILHSQLSNP